MPSFPALSFSNYGGTYSHAEIRPSSPDCSNHIEYYGVQCLFIANDRAKFMDPQLAPPGTTPYHMLRFTDSYYDVHLYAYDGERLYKILGSLLVDEDRDALKKEIDRVLPKLIEDWIVLSPNT
jgi:hypothetical protein